MAQEGFIPVKDIALDKSLYRALTKLLYSSESDSISTLINDMLSEYMHTYILSKRMGHMLVSKDVVRTAFSTLTDEQIKQAASANAIRYKDGALLEYGKPSLSAYLELITSFAKANKFEYEISKDAEAQLLVMSFGTCGSKFTRFKAETYRILLEEFAEVKRFETTDTAIYIEFKPKKEETVQETVAK